MNTQIHLRRISNRATRRISMHWGKSLNIYPVMEYPKCGGTWLCRMLADTLGLPFAQYSCSPIAMPSVVHGHWKYHPKIPNVVYLQRDGRDIIVSYYFHCCRRYRQGATTSRIQRTLERLYGRVPDLEDCRANLPKFIHEMYSRPSGAPMNWRDYSMSWHDREGVIYTSYEKLRSDCTSELTEIVCGLDRESPSWRISRAVEGQSMERVTGRSPGVEDRSSFIRKGVVGDWVNWFSKESMEIFSEVAGDALVAFGYEQHQHSSRWSAAPQPAKAAPDGPEGSEVA